MTASDTASNDAAAACQRLRGHLAYLKLPAALEALPAILDAARDGQLSALEAIEQLIGTEADAAEARKLASRLHWAALPAPWRIELSGVDLDRLAVVAGGDVADASVA